MEQDFLETAAQARVALGQVAQRAASRFSRRTGTSTRSILIGGPML
jgi:hypothetical protein